MPLPRQPVVFIPALLCDEALYGKVISSLEDLIEAQVMLSPRPDMATSVADILSRVPAGRFVLVGTSYGGSLAMEVALAAPDRVKGLCLMGCDPSAPAPGGPDLAAALEATPAAVVDMLTTLVVRQDAADAAMAFREMASRVGMDSGVAQLRALAAKRDIRSLLPALTMPALVLWGQDDAIVPAAMGRALADALPDAQFQEIAHCGHLPTLEKPAQCAARFRAFLEELQGTP